LIHHEYSLEKFLLLFKRKKLLLCAGWLRVLSPGNYTLEVAMKAVGSFKYFPIDDPGSFVLVDVPTPSPAGRDLLVRVKAVSVNPVDTKIRASLAEAQDKPVILGYDAAGVVESIGDAVTLFKPGDEVFYAGSRARSGCNSEYHLVDERIVGHKPASLTFEEAAALPLTSITAWEAFFDRLGIVPDTVIGEQSKTALLIGGAGGVGSIAIQVAKRVARLRVIATASRDESRDWCKRMGADLVINHQKQLRQGLKEAGVENVAYILCFNSIELYIQQLADIIQPEGKICSIVGPRDNFPILMNPFFSKSVTFAWELMFTRPVFQTVDMQTQHDHLEEISKLVDRGELRTTLTERFGPLTPENLRRAHARIESGHMIGKLALSDL
jgi:NADPH2:quinone reductase